MNDGVKIRIIIHNVLYDIFKNNLSLEKAFIKRKVDKLSKRDISFIYNVSLSSMRYFFHTKKIISVYAKNKVKINELILLNSAITQIIFLDFKQYAVIDSTVEVAKKINIYHGFINSILKNIAKNKKNILKIGVEYNELPIWFQKKTINLEKFEKDKFLKTFSKKPDLHFVFKNPEDLLNFEFEITSTSKTSGFAKINIDIEKIDSYKKGVWWIQDYSSFFPLKYYENKLKNKTVIDLCAAPGGKTFQIKSKNIDVVINDKNKSRNNLLKDNLSRLGFSCEIMNYDVLKMNTSRKYDFIILDAPCSSVGTIRRNPEIFYRAEEPNFTYLLKAQEKMLEKCVSLLKSNGTILYMVCSFLKCETQDQIKLFLSKNKNFLLNSFIVDNNRMKKNNIFKNGFMWTIPTTILGHNIDGYFAAYLKKIN